MISGGSEAAAAGADHFTQAYHALRADPSIQFKLLPRPAPPAPPPWIEAIFSWIGRALEPIGRVLGWIGSYFPAAPVARIFLWTVIFAAAAALLWALYNRLVDGEWRLRRRRVAAGHDVEVEEEWAPAEEGARSWLDEADALADQGRFAEAIHHLLFRCVEDIASRRPALVRPALTSRELAAAEGIPAGARELFSRIARLVERSLFGGRAVRDTDWLSAREAYSNFLLAAAWRP